MVKELFYSKDVDSIVVIVEVRNICKNPSNSSLVLSACEAQAAILHKDSDFLQFKGTRSLLDLYKEEGSKEVTLSFKVCDSDAPISVKIHKSVLGASTSVLDHSVLEDLSDGVTEQVTYLIDLSELGLTSSDVESFQKFMYGLFDEYQPSDGLYFLADYLDVKALIDMSARAYKMNLSVDNVVSFLRLGIRPGMSILQTACFRYLFTLTGFLDVEQDQLVNLFRPKGDDLLKEGLKSEIFDNKVFFTYWRKVMLSHGEESDV